MNNLNKFVILGIFGAITIFNLTAFLAFRKTFLVPDEVSLNKTLDFGREYDVKLDVDYLRNNFEPAHE